MANATQTLDILKNFKLARGEPTVDVTAGQLLTRPISTIQFLPQGQTDIIGKQIQAFFPGRKEAPLTKVVEALIEGKGFARSTLAFVKAIPGALMRPVGKEEIIGAAFGATGPIKQVGAKGVLEVAKKVAPKARALLKEAVPTAEKFLEKFPSKIRKFVPEAIIPKSEQAVADITAQRRGVISDVELRALAKGETKVLDKFAEFKPGTAANAEDILAAREEISDRVLESLLGKPQEVEALAAGARGVLGARAEAGRAVRQFQLELSPEKLSQAISKLSKAIDEAVDPLVKQQLTDIRKVVAGNIKDPIFIDKLVEWATAIKLTSYRTPFRAGLGNAVAAVIKFPEKFVAGALIDPIRSFITRTPRESFVREAFADLIGSMHGIKQGAKDAVKSLVDESFAAMQQRGAEAIPIGGAIKGTLGKIVRFPFRIISAPDAFFRAVNKEGAVAGEATRRALKEGLKGEALVNRINEIIKSGIVEEKAVGQAAYRVFQEELDRYTATLNSLRGKLPFTKLVVAFFKTPVNLFKFGVERSPLAPILPKFWKAVIKQGGEEANQAIARMVVGSGIVSGLTMYALDGSIQGSWQNLTPAERDARYRQGKQPFSFKIGNKYYSYRGLEPLSYWATLSAELADAIGKEKELSLQLVVDILTSISEDFSNQPFLLGLNNLFEALSDPEEKAQRFISDLVRGTTLPVAIGDIARLYDPTVRKTEGIIEGLKANIPGLSKGLLPKRNVFGESIIREGGLLQRLSPVVISTEKEVAIEKELQKLEITIGFPQQQIYGIKFTPEEMNVFSAISGKLAKKVLLATLTTQEYVDSIDFEKKQTIENIISDARSVTREAMFGKIFLTRWDNPDRDARIKFRKEEFPKMFEQAPIEIQKMILELLKDDVKKPTLPK